MSMPHRSVREPDAPGDCGAWSAPGAAAERAECQLRRHGYLALWHLSCAWAGGVLTLRGRLPTYYLKQVAQEAVAGVVGVERVVNDIEVTAPTGYGSPGSNPHEEAQKELLEGTPEQRRKNEEAEAP